MKIIDIINKKQTLSFEFFPPKDQSNIGTLNKTIDDLSKFNPDFVSFTYGAGGSTRKLTLEISAKTKNSNFSSEVMSHLTCITHTENEIIEILNNYEQSNIENIIALRGDLPKNSDEVKNHLPHATDLIEIIKNHSNNFCIAAACYPESHPESSSKDNDLNSIKLKQSKGADFLITQLFFNNNDFFNFRDMAIKSGVKIPIIPAIMPITSTKQIRKFTDMCGASIPDSLNKKLETSINNDEETTKFGIEFATNQIKELLDNNVNGIHFYSLNKSRSVKEVINNINI
ncbi:MAG: methylenetetrahydrofolate reductase [NAD(P)H] [Dehalococcoidia bacterium]